MIKMEYRFIDKNTMRCKAEFEGKDNELVIELSEFMFDTYEKDHDLVVKACDRFLDLVGFDKGDNDD